MNDSVRVISCAGLTVGQIIEGPAIITEPSSTIWLVEGWRAEVDDVGELQINLETE